MAYGLDQMVDSRRAEAVPGPAMEAARHLPQRHPGPGRGPAHPVGWRKAFGRIAAWAGMTSRLGRIERPWRPALRAVGALLLAALCLVPAAFAALGLPYEQTRFDALMKEGRPVLVWFHVDWCPTCRAQDGILRELVTLPELRRITVLRVDFDQQKKEVRKFRAIRQGTFILFNGGKEVGRSLGGTYREDILEFLRAAF